MTELEAWAQQQELPLREPRALPHHAEESPVDPVLPEQWDTSRLPAATMVLAFALIATAQTFRRGWGRWWRRLGVTAFAG